MPESDKKQPDEFSKSKLKREMLALQKIGSELIALPAGQLAKIDLPENLLDAIKMAHALKNQHEAKRRHLQYIGKIMRTLDCVPIVAALEKVKQANSQNTAHFHRIEQWREQLIVEGDAALQKLLDLYPNGDKQQIRQLIRKCQQDRVKNKSTGAESELFKVLRLLLQNDIEPEAK
jgi:ribosome-associated protein